MAGEGKTSQIGNRVKLIAGELILLLIMLCPIFSLQYSNSSSASKERMALQSWMSVRILQRSLWQNRSFSAGFYSTRSWIARAHPRENMWKEMEENATKKKVRLSVSDRLTINIKRISWTWTKEGIRFCAARYCCHSSCTVWKLKMKSWIGGQHLEC